MDETVAEYMDSLITHRTSYYIRSEEGEILNAPFVDNSYKWAGGGFIGTAEDLITFGKEIFWGDFLQSETLEMLTTSLELSSGEKTNYGIGWAIGNGIEDRRYFGHSGGSVGGTTQFVVFPEQKLILAVICNMSNVSYGGTHLRIADYFMDAAPIAAGNSKGQESNNK
jgi:CubicO group peptidase (beta-lactamase class C family)